VNGKDAAVLGLVALGVFILAKRGTAGDGTPPGGGQPAFDFGPPALEWQVWPQATDLRLPVLTVEVSNPASQGVRHVITPWSGVVIGGSQPDQLRNGADYGVEPLDLTLAPGERRTLTWQLTPWLAVYNVTQYYYFWVQDESGNKSATTRG